MDTEYDVIIVGGGIAGIYTGRLLAEAGHNVLITEEHHEIGRPVQCAGLVTPRITTLIPELSKNCILNEVHGAKIYSPNGNELVIDAKETKALVLDRLIFDRELAVTAVHAGCDFAPGARVVAAKFCDEKINIELYKNGVTKKIKAKLLIGADGVQGRVAHWFGLKGPRVILSGFGAELIDVDVDPGFVEIYLGNSVAPNFFSWVIPKARNTKNGSVPARVGLACKKKKSSAYHYYRQLFKHTILGPKLTNAKPIQYVAGGVPLGMVPKSYADNVLLVGDSAGQVKPTSGGGIYTSLVCAKYCTETAALALETGDLSAKMLRNYHRAWQNEFGKELKHGLRLFKVFMHLTDEQLEYGFKLLSDPEVLEIISREGDIDYPSKMTMALFKRVPQLLMFAKPYIRSFF